VIVKVRMQKKNENKRCVDRMTAKADVNI
jgi:hypothetical protein